MPEFRFQEMFPHGEDTTPYRRLDGDWVGTDTFRGEPILVVDPAALTRLAAEAVRDVSHLFRPGHLAPLPRGEAFDLPRTDRRPHQPQGWQADRGRHAPHLSVAALPQRQGEPGRRNRLAEADRRVAWPEPLGFGHNLGVGRPGGTVAERDPGTQGGQGFGADLTLHLCQVGLGQRRARLADARLPGAEIGEDHEALAVEVEATGRVETAQR